MVYFVGTDVPYGFYVHEGVDRRFIAPHGGKLAFRWWRIAGRGFGPSKDTFITKSFKWPKGYVDWPGISLTPRAGNKGVQPFLIEARDEVLAQELKRKRR